MARRAVEARLPLRPGKPSRPMTPACLSLRYPDCTSRQLRRPCLGEPSKVTSTSQPCQPLSAPIFGVDEDQLGQMTLGTEGNAGKCRRTNRAVFPGTKNLLGKPPQQILRCPAAGVSLRTLSEYRVRHRDRQVSRAEGASPEHRREPAPCVNRQSARAWPSPLPLHRSQTGWPMRAAALVWICRNRPPGGTPSRDDSAQSGPPGGVGRSFPGT